MELLGGRVPFTQFQEEKYQMLELNQRLESYLGHVKLLEEENKLLREEIHTLKSSKEPPGQRKAQEEALSQARRMLEEAWRKKDRVVMEVENLMEDIEVVSIQRQKAKNAKAEAQRKHMESRKELEEERRAQIWLREKSGQLEKDLLLQMQVHQENMETLHDSLKQTKQVLMTPQPTQTTSIPDLGQEYSYRAAQAWQEATNNYLRLVGRLEESLHQAKANMAKIHQEKRENQHQVQHLAKELESTKTKRQMLEKNVVQQREEHTQELQYLQAQVDALELEKDSLGHQIDSLMVDRQNLLQVKMSLGMEVATYRALLDSEGQRIDRPTTKKTSSAFFLDVFSKPTGTQPASQTTAASCHVSNTVSTSHRSITSSHTLLTRATPSWTPTRGTPQRTPTSTSVTEKTKVHISEQTEKAAEESVDHVQQEKVHEDMVLKTTLPAAEPEPQLKPEDSEIKENEPIQFMKAQMVECKTDAPAFISASADQPSNLSQTSETEIWAGPFTDPAGDSEEGKHEDTEVSFVMAQISRAPKVACEEKAKDENDDTFEMDVRSENISESHTFAYGDAENHDDDALKSSHISVNTSIMGSSFLEQGTLDMAGDCGYHEDLMTVDKQDNVSNISEEGKEKMNSGTDAAIDSMKEMDRHEEIELENEMKVASPDSEEEEEDEMNIDADTKFTKEDTNVTEIEEEEIEVIKSDFSVPDEGVDSPKNSDHQESLEKTVLPTEPHSDQTVNEEDPSKPEDSEIKEDEPIQSKKAQMVECKTDAPALISASADQPSNLSQTSETEIWAGPFTDPAGDSEEGKHEDTEVSFVMAQFSHSPEVACEENITIAKDENDDTFEMDVRSENISESHTFAYGDAENNDDDALKSSHISANTSIMGSSFLEQGTLDMAGDFGYHEDLMTVDKQDNVSNISEEGKEKMNSGTEAVIDSMKEMDRHEEIELENEMKVVSPDSVEEEEDEMNIDADTKFTKEDTNVTEIEEEEIEVIKSDFSVPDEGVDSPKNSDHQESLEKTVLPTEPHSDQTVNEEDPSKPEDSEIKEDEPILFTKAQMVECKTDASALISVSADKPSNLSQTSETEIWAGPFTDPAGDSEEKKDEDTEVSFEMAQISRAPKVACEENKTIAKDKNIDNSEIDVRSENISESHTFAYGDAENNDDDDALKSSNISANTSIMGSSFLEQGTLDMAGDCGYHEDLMTVDKQDNVSNISEEGKEKMNSGTEAVIDLMKEMDRQEEIERENEMKVVSPDSVEEEEDEMNIDADTKVTKEDRNVTVIEEEEIEVIKSDFSVPDEGVDSSKNSDHQESLEKTVLPTEPHSDQTVNEEDPSKPEDTEIKENEPIQFMKAQMVECKTDAPALISASADQPSNLSQTSETEIWAGPFTDPAGDSEEGKHEDTEVSFVMAQISRAHKVACEENKTIVKDENDETFEMDVRSENISESHTFAYGDAENNDDDALKSSHISANTSIMGSSFLEQGTLDMAGDCGYHEDLMTVDKQDNVSNISEEGKEQMNSGTDAVIDSMKEMDRHEEIEPENEMKVASPDSEEEEEDEMNIDADTKFTKEDEYLTEIEEEEIEVIKSDFSVPDEGVDSPKNSDHQESLEKTVLPTEPHSDQTVNEEDPSKPEDSEIKENEPIQSKKAQMVECKTDAPALISASADKPSNLSQTSETEIWAGPFTDPAGDSEEGKHEDTEVSFVMAQISRAPKVACEEKAKDENDDTFEMDVRSENISESHTFAYGDAENNDDDDALKSSHISANTSIMGSSFLEQGTLDMAGDFGYHEDLMTVDKQDNVSNISEEGKEKMNSGTDAAIDSMKEMDRQEEIERENEMKVVSPDSEEEEEDEMNIDADTKVTKEDTNVTEIEEEEIEVIKSDFSVPDEGVDSSMNSDHQESLEKTVLPTEPHSDQTVNEEESFPEEAVGEEENQGEDDDSPNIAFCRTDPGECDSYSLENTIADTRPLIHHKSDEETKGNVQASHLIGETSDSEGEKERMEGANLKEGASKHCNTMEDLTEEPDMEVTGEMVTEDNVSKEEVQDSDMTCIKPQSDSEVHERIELKGNLEEHSDFITEMRKAEDHDVKAYEQPQLTENQHMHTEQPEDETVHSYESQEHPISFPETSHQLKNLFETPSTLTMFQDAAATKNSEDLMEASMHTNVDLKLSRSLESKISSQPDSMTSDIPNSDQEEGNSSEEESPNASQCFQSTSLLTVATLNKLPFTFTNGVSKADSVSDVNYLPEEALSKEKNTEEPKTPQTDDWENSDIWSKSMNAPDATEIMHASSMDENTGVFPVNETESLEISNKTSGNIFGKFEEQFERTLESFSEKVLTVMDCESTSSGENEEFQSKEKKSEIHSFFSTSMKEDFWSQGKLEMVATYDPAKTEDLDQAMVFGEEWRDMERMPTANLSPKEKMAILEGQEEKHKDKKPAQGKMVLSDDSVDEGDSWSSGDE